MEGARPLRYKHPAGTAQSEIVIKNSVFIGTVGHAPTVEAAQAFIAQVRTTYPDAHHHAWAYFLHSGPQGLFGFSDDGEPGGTAGRPMLAVLQGSGIEEIVAVGTRYFGGIKLGTGGLVRAYSQCLREALKSLPVQECLLHHVVRFEVDYALYGAIRHHLPSFGVYVEDTLFGAQVALTLAVPFDRAEALEAMLREMTNGAVILRTCTIGEKYAAPLLGG